MLFYFVSRYNYQKYNLARTAKAVKREDVMRDALTFHVLRITPVANSANIAAETLSQARTTLSSKQTPMNSEYDTILSQVRRWPVNKRLALLEDVLQTLVPAIEKEVTRPKDTLSNALGLLRRSDTVPTDDEVESWLAHHRLEKYG